MLHRKFFNDFGTAFGIGSIILDYHFNRSAGHTPHFIDQIYRRQCRAFVPATIHRTNTGPMHTKTDFDRLGPCRPCRARAGEYGRHAGNSCTDKRSRGLKDCPPGDPLCLCVCLFSVVLCFGHFCSSLRLIGW